MTTLDSTPPELPMFSDIEIDIETEVVDRLLTIRAPTYIKQPASINLFEQQLEEVGVRQALIGAIINDLICEALEHAVTNVKVPT